MFVIYDIRDSLVDGKLNIWLWYVLNKFMACAFL